MGPEVVWTDHAFEVSAPAKAIVCGEHAVVYGKSAVAVALSLRTSLKVEPLSTNDNSGLLRLSLPDLQHDLNWDSCKLPWKAFHASTPGDDHRPTAEQMAAIDSAVTTACACPTTKGDPLCRAVARAFLFLYMSLTDASAQGCSFVLGSQIPIGAGLGSSGSICVCLAAAFLTTRAKRITRGGRHGAQLSPGDLDAINRWALAGEVCTHGTPSGVDNAISTWGGVLVYRQPSASSSSSSSTSTSSSPSAGSASSPSSSSSPTRDSGNGAAQLPPSTHFLSSPATATATAQQLSVLLIDTNQPRSTRAQLDKVASFTRSHPVFAATLLAAIDALSVSAARLFTEDDDDEDDDTAGSLAPRNNDDRVRRLGALMRLNHHLLVALGASHPRVERACEIVAEKGVGWAKLTGAGGGGCVLVLLEPGVVVDHGREKLGEAKGELLREGFGVIEAGVGGDGVGVDVSSC